MKKEQAEAEAKAREAAIVAEAEAVENNKNAVSRQGSRV
jgi:hypothetical protein